MAYCPFISTVNALGVLVSHNCIGSSCQIWDATNSRCGAKTSDIHFHLHNSHDHPLAHKCSAGFITTCGSDSLPQLVPRASFLIQEFIFNEALLGLADLDGNVKVYGYSYRISDTEGKPPVLTQIESHPSWDASVITCEITWEEFNNWYKDPDLSESNPFRPDGPCGE